MKTQLLIHPEELNDKWIDRAARLGVDVLGLHPVGGKAAPESLRALLQKLETPAFRALLDRAAEKGLSIEYELHAAGYLAPRELFASHPEYFREWDGERVADVNFCPSSPEMLDIVARRAAELAGKLYRSTHNYYFWMDDKKESECHCPLCRELSPSDQQMLVMNRIIGELRKTDPEAKLAYLAYFKCTPPPEKVKPAPGIFLEYAPFEKDMTVRVGEEPVGREVDALLAHFPAKDAKILEYWYDNSLFSKWKKPPVRFVPDNRLIADDIAFYRARGAEYISSFACYLGKDYEALWGEADLSAFAKENF